MTMDSIEIEYEKFFEMSNLTPEDTGLPVVIWINPMTGKEGPWARIKVQYDNKFYIMPISDTPEWKIKSNVKNPFSSKITKMLQQFVKQNKDVLLEYWNSKGSMSMKLVYKKLKKIKK
jgi:hypothetical protein